MQMILFAGVVGMTVPGVAILWLLRTFYSARACGEGSDGMDISWRDYRPFHRLLDPADFEFLRRRGVGAARIEKLRSERRTIYRLCLRQVAHDFNRVHRMLSMILVQSHVDRPDLAAELARQRLTFYRGLLLAEFRLALHGWGVNMPAIDLLAPLEILQTHLRMLAPAAAA